MNGPKKYMFSENVFDEPEEDEEELLEPPPPTFSEVDLEEARRTAYEQAYKKGRDEAAEEARQSREQFIAGLLQKISNDFGLIFSEENRRDDIFEQEVVRVCLAIFEKLFPVYMEQEGRTELQAILRDVLGQYTGKSEIAIEVPPGTAQEIQNFINTLKLENDAQNRMAIRENEDTAPDSCRLSWADGGAVRDGQALAGHIKNILEEALAHKENSPDPTNTPTSSTQENQEKTHENPAKDDIVEKSKGDSDSHIAYDDAQDLIDNPPENGEKPDE